MLLVVAIFHRPLFHTAARLVLIKVAMGQNVKLDVKFSGTIFTNLTVKDVQALPTGKGPSPVEKITISSVTLQYSIPNLIKHGLGEFLQYYEIREADLVLSGDSKDDEEKKQKKSLAQNLNTMLGQPALYADQVLIENFNLTINDKEDGPIAVKAFSAFFHPWEPGYLRIGRIQIPKLPVWENIDAETSYAKRNLFIRGIQLDPQLVLDEVNFDATLRSENKGSSYVKARIFGGTVYFALAGTELKKKGENLKQSYDTVLRLEAAGVDIHAAAAYFGAKKLPQMKLGWAKIVFKGEPERPRTWNGDSSIRIEALALDKAKIDAIQIQSVVADGLAHITAGEIATGQSKVTFKGTAQLPESVNNFPQTEGDMQVTIAAPSLAELTAPFMPKPVAGAAHGGGTIGVHARKATVDLAIDATAITQGDAGVESAKLKLIASKALDFPPGAGALDGLTSKVAFDAKALRFGTFTADSAIVEAASVNERVTLRRAEIVRAENSVSVVGTYQIPQPGRPAAPLAGEFSIKAPKLETFGIGKGGTILTGHLEGGGKVSMVNNAYSGDVTINGGDFTFGEFKARKLTAAIAVADNKATIERIALEIDGNSQIALMGATGVQPPYEYEAALLVLFRDLTVLQPLLETFGVKEKLEGSVDLSVESQGKAQSKEFSGQMKLAIDRAKYGKIALHELRLGGLFGPNFAESSEFRVSSGETSLQAGLEWRENRLRLKDIDLRQGEQQALTGYILLPFEPQNKEQPIPYAKRIAANVNAKELDIQKLLASFGQTAPASGTVNMNLVLGGTGLRPTAHLKVQGRNLKSQAAAQLDPAELDLVAHYSEKELTLDLTARQKEIQPLTVKGHVPLDLEAALQEKKLDPNLPLDLTVKLPPTSLAFLTKVVPNLRSIAGTAAIDAHVGGKVQTPEFAGSATVKVEYARMKNEGVPGIGGLDIDIGFTQEAVSIRRFRGELGGGKFELAGGVQFPKITEPVFGLKFKADEVLVKRDDSITVRIDSDIAVDGPLAAGKVAGTIWVTHSRFFRDIDILPIALPGRPKPKPKPKPREVQGGGGPPTLPPMLANWTFDVAIKTRADDPFKVQGNLANGAASIDLHFGGTGAAPWLDGSVRVDRLTASLPFSKLEVKRGFILFSRDAFLEPKLDLYAESQLRDYHINAYIFGSAKDPEVSLTSEPPLPQQDIISLLATGTTVAELTGNSDVLASRAAVLLFQSLYRKVFKKKDPTEGLPMHDRMNVEFGAADSKTGRQELSASFRLGNQLYLVGDIDVGGEFTGRVKYLLRFR